MPTYRWGGGCCNQCFKCDVGEITVTPTLWTGGPTTWTITDPSEHPFGPSANSLQVNFSRHIYRGLYFEFTYSTDGTLITPWFTVDAVAGTLSTFQLSNVPCPSSGTVIIKSSLGDLGMYDDDNNPIVDYIPNATEVYINGDWLFSAPGENGVYNGSIGFQATSGTESTVGNFVARKIYESRGCPDSVGTWCWPPGKPTSLTLDITVANLTKPPPAQSELPCEECDSLSGSYTLIRVDDGLMSDDDPAYGGFSAGGGLTQLWMASCSSACPADFGGGVEGSGFEYVYLYHSPSAMFTTGVLVFGFVADWQHPTYEYIYGIGGVNEVDLWNGNEWERSNTYITETGSVTENVITLTRTIIDDPNAPAGGLMCRYTSATITANYA